MCESVFGAVPAFSVSGRIPIVTISGVVRVAAIVAAVMVCVGGVLAGDDRSSDRVLESSSGLDVSRIAPANHVTLATNDEALAARAAAPCQSVVYHNGPATGAFLFGLTFGGDAPGGNSVDDCTLPFGSADRFICGVQVRTFGLMRNGGAATYNLRVRLWSRCPDASGASVIADGIFPAIPNDTVERIQTLTIDPAYLAVDDTLWVQVESDNPDASWLLVGSPNDPGDVGSSSACFASVDGNGTCIDDTTCGQFGSTIFSFPVTLLGSPGPLGSCCDVSTGLCTDGVLRADCDNVLTQTWSALSCGARTDCVVCSVANCVQGSGGNIENEPDCLTNYVDVVNRGCSDVTIGSDAGAATPITCGQSGCGRSGTYSFLNGANLENRRDDDHYVLSLTQDTRVTWRVSAQFPSEAIISFTVRQTNGTGALHCPTYTSSAPGDVSVASSDSCGEAVATACLPGGGALGYPLRYYLRARPAVEKLGENAVCGLSYEFDVQCQPCALPTGACCTASGCVQVSRLACMIATGDDAALYHGDGSTCGSVACGSVPANDTCPNATVLTCSSCVLTYDTTFAGGEGQSFGQNGPVQKDVWYRYNVTPPAGCANGRIVVSTIGTCFNSKAQLLRINNCSASASTQCATLSVVGGGSFLPMILEVGPPRVNVGPFVYGRSSQTAVSGQCFRVRVGGLTDDDYGAGTVRLDFVCVTPQAGFAWASTTGRCCLPDGSCVIAPMEQPGGSPLCCASIGGYLRNTADFLEGAQSPVGAVEVASVGCATLPCPKAGEACFNALDFSAVVGASYGQTTRLIKNRLYYRYTVPAGAAVGSGLAIDTCGSDFDTAIAVYRGFNLTTGECHNEGNAPGGAGVRACSGAAYNNSEAIRADDCGPSNNSATPALGIAACYGSSEETSCTCLRIVAAGQTPLAGEVAQGDTIWIGIGVTNDRSTSSRPFLDPIRADDCSGPRFASLSITNPVACFTCSLACPPGATPEGETIPTPNCNNYTDITNAGCLAASASQIAFSPIACGQTICGTSATYHKGATCTTTCPAGQTCVSGVCVGTNENAKDVDVYRIQITTPQRLTWSVSSSFPAAIQIVASPTNDCADQTIVASQVGLVPCSTVSASADVCPGWFYLVVQPTSFESAPCGSLYYATLSCAPAPAASCCKGDANNDGIVNGDDISAWLGQFAPPVGTSQSQLDPVGGCLSLRTCAADFTNDSVVDLADLSGFVTALLATPTCPPTQCEASAACHLPSSNDSGVISDISPLVFGSSYRCADDFSVTSGTSLSNLCWWGFYFDFDGFVGCSPSAGDSADNFLVTIYSDASGVPGNVISGPVSPINLVKTDTGADISYLARTVRRYKFEAQLPTPLAVTPGACYWIEIVNHTSGDCLWMWETSSIGGNSVSVQKPGGAAGAMSWQMFDRVANDFAFCLPGLRLSFTDCGLPLGRCCVYAPGGAFGTCTMQSRPVCESLLGGTWSLAADCSEACPVVLTSGGCPGSPTQSVGPDVVVGDITGPANFASSGTLEALTLGATACNLGDQEILWDACPANTHPIFGGNMFKWYTTGGVTRFEQIGQGWLKNGFGANQDPFCCATCQPSGNFQRLGAGCSDPYVASQASIQGDLSPKYIVNAHTAAYPTGCTVNPSGPNAGYLEMEMADLAVTNGGEGAPVRFFVSFQYLTADDATAHNQNNNQSTREIAVAGGGTAWDFFFPPGSSTLAQIPTVRMWKVIDSGVVETDVNVPEDDGFPGLVILAAKVTSLGGGMWHYEYVVNNLNSDRSIGSFSVPCPAGATVTNIGFRDVAYRHGDGLGSVTYDGTDWPGAFAGGAVTWATTPFSVNNNANAIRWGTMYNFRFDADRPPLSSGMVTLGQFKVVNSVPAQLVVPSP